MSDFTITLCRKAYVQYLLRREVADGVKGLKRHGAKDKVDNMTCLMCLAPPDTYHDVASLQNEPVFFELTKLLGVSTMHLKIRLFELVWHVGVVKRIKPALDSFKTEVFAKLGMKKAMQNKMISEKKVMLEKEAVIHFQQEFAKPAGGGLRPFVPEPQKGGNSNTGNIANRFFRNSKVTSKILDLPIGFIDAVWLMLRQLSSCTKMIDVTAYKVLARQVFDLYMEDYAEYKQMTANLHLLVSHIPDWVDYIQKTFGFAPGRLTEGTLERGHGRIKLIMTRFSR